MPGDPIALGCDTAEHGVGMWWSKTAPQDHQDKGEGVDAARVHRPL